MATTKTVVFQSEYGYIHPFPNRLDLSRTPISLTMFPIGPNQDFHIKHGEMFMTPDGLSDKPYNWKLMFTTRGFQLVKKNGRILMIRGKSFFSLRKYSIFEKLAIVHWGGYYSISDGVGDFLIEGATVIKQMGCRHLKLYLGHRSDEYYRIHLESKVPHEIASQSNYKKVLSMGWNTVVLVCHATVFNPNKGEVDSKFWKDDTLPDSLYQEEQSQMKQLAKTLERIAPRTNFIITNWEGDNMVSEDNSEQVYSNMTRWFRHRQAGIDEAKTLNVKHGIEVNWVSNLIHDPSTPCVLSRVVPNVATDYISYSCYEIDNFDQLRANLDLIQSYSYGRSRIIIGEFGAPINNKEPQQVEEYISAFLKIIDNSEVELCCYWQIFENEFDENGNPRGFGLINPEKRVTGLWFLFSDL